MLLAGLVPALLLVSRPYAPLAAAAADGWRCCWNCLAAAAAPCCCVTPDNSSHLHMSASRQSTFQQAHTSLSATSHSTSKRSIGMALRRHQAGGHLRVDKICHSKHVNICPGPDTLESMYFQSTACAVGSPVGSIKTLPPTRSGCWSSCVTHTTAELAAACFSTPSTLQRHTAHCMVKC